MDPLQGMLYGLGIALQPENLVAAFLGVLIGTAVGVLPGLGVTAGTALILPATFSFPPVTGLIAMAGVFYGGMYGGSTTSILMNIPGEVAAIVTCIDGYEMTKKGRAGAALAIVAVGSFIAGTLAVLGVALFAPTLASMALSFGPPEFFALVVVALLALAGISSQSLPRAFFGTTLGLLFATVGMEMVTGVTRFDFGSLDLARGLNIVPVCVGLFGISEVFFLVEKMSTSSRPLAVKLRELFPTREEWRRSVVPYLRGTGIGFLVGLLPGPVGPLSTFASYRVEKSVSRHPAEFGHGAVEGVAGPEAANNAAACAANVPLLSLGIPFAPIMALLVAAMLIQGVQPGPLLITQHPEIFWGFVSSMYIGNVMSLVLNLPMVGIWVSLLRVPLYALIPCILLYSMIGAYSVDNAFMDFWVLLGFGVLGYIMRKLDFDCAGLILALVLGPRIEKHLRESLFMSRGDVTIFFGSPIAITLWGFGLLIVAGPPLLKLIRRGSAQQRTSPRAGREPPDRSGCL